MPNIGHPWAFLRVSIYTESCFHCWQFHKSLQAANVPWPVGKEPESGNYQIRGWIPGFRGESRPTPIILPLNFSPNSSRYPQCDDNNQQFIDIPITLFSQPGWRLSMEQIKSCDWLRGVPWPGPDRHYRPGPFIPIDNSDKPEPNMELNGERLEKEDAGTGPQSSSVSSEKKSCRI